jgi:solute carrier family 35 protein F5
LIIGASIKVEKFSIKKLIGVLASLAGIVMISTVDLSSDSDKNRGDFPHKSHQQIAIGDAMAFLSAVLYGIYTVILKKRIGDESRVDMVLFFGFVGLFNVIFLWPGFIVFHYTGLEAFSLPPTRKIWAVILVGVIYFDMDFVPMMLTTFCRQTLSHRCFQTFAGHTLCC